MAEGREPVYAYVDGMNLYYGALKHNPGYKWLDVSLLMANLVPDFTIVHTRFYTARVKATFPGDPGPVRQRVYLEALQSRPRITVKEGVYADWPRWQRLDEMQGLDSPGLFRPRLTEEDARTVGRILQQAKERQPPSHPFVLVKIRRTEEKGSDVNLATDLLKDALSTPLMPHRPRGDQRFGFGLPSGGGPRVRCQSHPGQSVSPTRSRCSGRAAPHPGVSPSTAEPVAPSGQPVA